MRYKIEKEHRYSPEFYALMVQDWRKDHENLGWLYYQPPSQERGWYVSNEPDGYWTEWVDVEVFGNICFPNYDRIIPFWLWELLLPCEREGLHTMSGIILPDKCYKAEL